MSDLQIVEAFSRVAVPESILKNSNVSQLVAEMNLAKTTLDSAAAKLNALRQQKKESNFLSNMWNDQDDKIEDAQVALDKNVRWLSSLSSKLLILNTAMAKIMHGQQGVLQDQQLALTDQARGIERQNVQIKAQQDGLERNQREFNKAVAALAKATELTHAQAGELMRCIEKVALSEQRMLASYEQIAATVDERLHVIKCDWSKVLADKFVDLTDAQVTRDRRVDERLATSAASAVERLAASEQRMLALHAHLSEAIEERLATSEASAAEQLAASEQRMLASHVHLSGAIEDRLVTSDASAAEQLAASEQRMLAAHEDLASTFDRRLQSALQTWSATSSRQEARFNDAYLALGKRVDERLIASDANTLGKINILETLLSELDIKLASIAAREATIAADVEKQHKALHASRIAHILSVVAIGALFLWTVVASSALIH
ncbi:hypothetical protein [Massilia sp. YIM B02443]|uniref:hypothetical protein n=1 Tax=Massilia sp. YIM B02443 TaxID=3050127 RepID=UPI0025B6BF58|nr:hypothetical protein [Massilia sp. YIM B02443]MDN4039969.1 hypothetical protein [Massilia sp. YIM B02443]